MKTEKQKMLPVNSMKEKYYIILNSTILYVIAFLITTILHEFGHAIMGMFYNSDPVLHHNFVQHLSIEHLTISQKTSIALTGPIVSLFQGFIAGGIFLRAKEHNMLSLLLLWLAVLGFNNFLGYLMTGPIFSAGDIGRSYQLLETSIGIQLAAALFGMASLLLMAYKLTAPFLRFSYTQEWVADGKSRKNFSFHILMLPWIIGSMIITFLYLPIVAFVSIIYPIMSGFIFIFPWQNSQRIENVLISNDKMIGKASLVAMIALLILVVVFKGILAPGVPLY